MSSLFLLFRVVALRKMTTRFKNKINDAQNAPFFEKGVRFAIQYSNALREASVLNADHFYNKYIFLV